jgi:hypothetical protein
MPASDPQGAAAPPPAAAPEGAGGGASTSPATPARPEYLPEKFWKDGAPNVEALAKSYTELEKMRGRFKDEAAAELRAGVPETPDAYELKAAVPEGVVWIEGDIPAELEPGKVYFKPDLASPEMNALRTWAHEAGVKPEAFGKLLGIAAQAMGVRVPTLQEREAARSEFFGGLGENGAQRAGHLYGQLRALLPESGVKAIDGMVSSKEAFEAIEALATRAGGARFAPAGAAPAGGVTEAGLKEMMRDPRYSDPLKRDPAFVQQVDQGWRQLYPGPLPSSHTGRAA